MFPGLNDLDCRVAEFRYQQLMSEGQRQQLVADVCPTSAGTCSVSTARWQQLGTLMVRAGQLLRGAQVVSPERLGAAPTGERATIA